MLEVAANDLLLQVEALTQSEAFVKADLQ